MYKDMQATYLTFQFNSRFPERLQIVYIKVNVIFAFLRKAINGNKMLRINECR